MRTLINFTIIEYNELLANVLELDNAVFKKIGLHPSDYNIIENNPPITDNKGNVCLDLEWRKK